MKTLATSTRTTKVSALFTLSRPATEAARAPAPRRTGFWTILLRALSAAAA